MRKRWIVLTLCTLVLLAIGCAVGTATVRQEPEGTAYQLYFLERTLADADGGDALRAEERAIDDSGCTAEETARLLLEALLRGPRERSCGWTFQRPMAGFPAWNCRWRIMPSR